jgi:hypothetical protein
MSLEGTTGRDDLVAEMLAVKEKHTYHVTLPLGTKMHLKFFF